MLTAAAAGCMSVSRERHWFERTANDITVERGFQVFIAPCEAPISVKSWMPLSVAGKDGDKSRVGCSA